VCASCGYWSATPIAPAGTPWITAATVTIDRPSFAAVKVGSEGHQAARIRELAPTVHGRQFEVRRHGHNCPDSKEERGTIRRTEGARETLATLTRIHRMTF
jgi:hypothetical protein